MKHKKITLPHKNGVNRNLPVYADKPPKLRFKPGQYVQFRNELFEIIYAYRVKEEPSEWRYCLEVRKQLSVDLSQDPVGQLIANEGQTTLRIIYDCFRDGMDAMQYFIDIPAFGDRVVVTNKQMIQQAKLISSGEVLK